MGETSVGAESSLRFVCKRKVYSVEKPFAGGRRPAQARPLELGADKTGAE